MIKGISVRLFERNKIGEDEFHHPIYEENPVDVENVLVAPSSTTEIVDSLNIFGKKAVYTIAIPKGDKHCWKDNRVEFFGESWIVIGFPQKGIEENVPLSWNEKWMVAKYA